MLTSNSESSTGLDFMKNSSKSHLYSFYKSKISIFIGCLFLSQVVFGQRNGFGIKAGVNFATLYDTPIFIEDQIIGSRITWHAGVYGRLPLPFSDQLFVQAELLLSQKGTRGIPIDPTSNSRLILPYLSAPVLLSYQPFTILSLQLGPEIAYRLDAAARIDGERQSLDGDFYRDIDLGMVLGLAYHGPGGLHISGRMNLGLIHFWRFNSTSGTGNSSIVRAGKHQIFQLSVGYLLVRRI